MKTRTREIAKPGIFGTVDNPTIVSERDLREIAETFPEIKKAPVSLNGHWPDPSKPRLGNVVSVSFDEATKTLVGTIEEQDVLADVVDKGYFPDASIGGKRRASDGKMYLHHLAYLGEEPPAVKNLINDIMKNLSGEASENEEGGIAASDEGEVVMYPSTSAPRLSLSDPAATNKPKEAPMRTLEQAEAELTAEKGKTTAQAAEIEKMKTALEKAGISLSDSSDPRVDVLMKQVKDGKKAAVVSAAAGKIPKAKQGLVLALCDSFSTGESIELSDGDKKVSKSQFDILVDLFASIPRLVEPGTMDLSDPAEEDGVDLTKIKDKF